MGLHSATVTDDQIDRALDRSTPLKDALERLLNERLTPRFKRESERLGDDLTCTDFERHAIGNTRAPRGDAHDYRPDGQQVAIARVVGREADPNSTHAPQHRSRAS